MKLAIINGKIGTVQLDAAIGLALTHAGEGPQIFKAYLDCGIFHRAACFRRITMRVHHFLTRFIKKADPAGNEAAFPQAGIFEALIQRRTATAAAAMAHHEDFGNFKLRHRKFERCRYAVTGTARFKRGNKVGHVANNKHLAG